MTSTGGLSPWLRLMLAEIARKREDPHGSPPAAADAAAAQAGQRAPADSRVRAAGAQQD